MKANDFFKKHGLAEVKILLTSPSHGFFFKEDFYKHYGFDIYDDLKRLVESHEIVMSWGGLSDARAVSKMGKYYKYLKKAIADVESCQ